MTKLYIRQNLHVPNLASLAAEPGILPAFLAWVDGYGRYTSVPAGTFVADGYHVITGYLGIQWADDSNFSINQSQIDGYTVHLLYNPQHYTAPIDQIIGEHLARIDEKLGAIDLIASGDVAGPASATDNAIARFDLTTGKLIQNSLVLVTDTGQISNLTSPTLAADAATKGYVDGYFVSILSSATPGAVSTAGAAGTAITASRADHVHALAFATVNSIIGTANASISVNSQKITNLLTPTLATDAATKGYIDGYNFPVTAVTFANVNAALATANASISVNSQKITNLLTPTLATDAATKGYVDGYFVSILSSATPGAVSTAGAAGTATTASRSDHVHALTFATVNSILGTANASISVNSQKITNLLTPTLATDAATKGYVDGYFVSILSSATPTTEVVGGSGSAGTSLLASRSDHVHPMPAFGTTSGTFAQGNDSRFSDARTPTAHAGTHIAGGSDPLDGYHIPLAYTPAYYDIPVDGYIGEHIAKIDQAIGAIEAIAAGDVAGPASSTDNAIARFDLTTGKIIQNSLVIITDAGIISNVTTPVAAADAATKGYVDGYFVSILSSATPGAVSTTGAAGTSTTASRSDHVHALTFATVNSILGTANTSISVNSQKITNLLTPTLATDATTKGYVDGYFVSILSSATPGAVGTAGAAGTSTTASRSDHVHALTFATVNSILGTANASISVNSQKITNLLTPTLATDAVTKGYVDGYFVSNLSSATPGAVGTAGAAGTGTTASRADHVHALTFATVNSIIGTANASISVNSQKITNLATPTASTDAVNKAYVDGYKKTTTVEFALTEDINNTTEYFFTWRSTGGDTATGKRSSSLNGIQNSNGASPYQVPFDATIVKAILTVRGVGVQNGSVTYPVSYRTNIMSVGFTSDSSLGNVDFSISNAYTVGIYSVGATNFKGSATTSINVNEGDMLGLKFINQIGASVAGQTRMAFVTLVLEAR